MRVGKFGCFVLIFLLPVFICPNLYGQVDGPGFRYSSEIVSDLSFASGNINSIVQDKQGFLWFGSWDGLFMYDGYTVRAYKPRPGFQKCFLGRKVRVVFSDSSGKLWVGTSAQGLHLFDRSQQCFRQFLNEPGNGYSVPENDIMGIWEDSRKAVWVATTNGYVCRIVRHDDSVGFENFSIQDKNLDFLSFARLSTDIVWLGTTDGLIRFDLQHPADANGRPLFQRVSVKTNFPEQKKVQALYAEYDHVSGSEILWLGTQKGVKRMVFNKRSGTIASDNFLIDAASPNSIENRVKAIYESKGDNAKLWLGTDDGIFTFSKTTGEFTRFRFPDDRTGDNIDKVISFFEDRSGVLWVGTNRGIKKLDKYQKGFRHIDLADAGGEVKQMIKTPGGDVFLATHGLGLMTGHIGDSLSAAESFHFRRLELEQQNGGAKFINVVDVDDEGNLWAGTDGTGLYKIARSQIRNGRVTEFRHYVAGSAGLSDDFIYSLLCDKRGDFWVGTYQGGLNRYDKKHDRFIEYDVAKGLQQKLSAFPIVKLLEDESGRIWIGTRGNGIYTFDPGQAKRASTEQFTHISAKTPGGLLDDFITDLYEDDRGRMWIGTEAGLCLLTLNSKKFTSFTRVNGFPGDLVQSIAGYDKGVLWVSSKSGIVKVNTAMVGQKGKEHLMFQSFNRNDGIENKFFNNNSALKLKKWLLFGGLSGVTAFMPSAIKSNPFAPSVALVDFELNHKSVPIGANINGRILLNKDIDEIDAIVLKHNEKVITFEFSALHYADPAKNTYAYKMEGFDENWIYTDANRRYAHYTNLPPGDYVFKVLAANNDGLWSRSAKTLNIKVLPPFWLTYWAFFLYLLLIAAILLAIRKLTLIRATLKHKIDIARLEKDKADELHNIELQYFTNISHEIRTPLTLILGPLEKLLHQGDLSVRAKNQLHLMHHHGERLYRLLNQLMDFRKHGMGQMKLQAAEGRIARFVYEIYISFREIAFDRQIEYQFDSKLGDQRLYFDRDLLEKVIYNLLSNAFKYTGNHGKISITVDKMDGASVKSSVARYYAHYEQIYNKDYISITISDTGQGISRRDLEHVFERFFRAAAPADKISVGTGIGLSLSKDLMLIHKGVISVESELKKGTRFVLFIPTGKEHFKEEEIITNFRDSEYVGGYSADLQEEVADSLILEKNFSSEKYEQQKSNREDLAKLLIVEDNEDVRRFITSVLQTNYEVMGAANGKEGMAKAFEEIPDLIISDIMMPEMDGIEFCRNLKKDERTSHIPVILLTARTSLIFKVEGIETGADDYITKPFSAAYLVARVKNLIEQRRSLKVKFSGKLYVKPKDITINSLDEAFLQKAIDAVNKNMSNSAYGIDDMCKDLAMSRMQLYRKLKAITGLAANEFIRNQRLQRAAQMLQQSQMTIAQVTYEVGFNDLKYFRGRFSEQFGMTPSEYAARFRNRKSASDSIGSNQ